MIGIKEDIFQHLMGTFSLAENTMLLPCLNLFQRVQRKKHVDIKDYQYFDVHNDSEIELFRNSFLSHLVDKDEVSVKEAIDDLLLNSSGKKHEFVESLNETFKSQLGLSISLENHTPRKNSSIVQRRFRIYQIVKECSKETAKQVFNLLKR